MIVAPPRINLRRAASYTHEKGPLSSTSSRFGFDHLVFASPPPSPGLPQLIPPKRRSSSTPRPSRVLRAVIYFAGLVSAFYLLFIALWGGSRTSRSVRDGLYFWPNDPDPNDPTKNTYEMVAKSSLPTHSTPVIVSDKHGNPKWTVSIPPNSNFPLTVNEYSSICAKCVEVANRVDALRGSSVGLGNIIGLGSLGGINKRKRKTSAERLRSFDSNFVDVHEAEVAGYLTGSVSIGTLFNQQANADDGDIVGESSNTFAGKPVCGRSLTFVLASSEAGLGRTMMLLWMAYAQSQSEGRGFFIDDTHWAYGRYAHIFAPPPSPACRPPLRHEMLPCPRQARHLVMTVDTADQFFFADKSDAAAGIAPDRSKHLFDLARKGYEALFRLNKDDANHVTQRVKQLKALTALEKRGDGNGDDSAGGSSGHNGKNEHGTIVGLHVRRGDLRPVEFQYRDSYVPLNLYADRAMNVIADASKQNKKSQKSPVAVGAGGSIGPSSLMVLASDDPLVYDSDEFAGAARAQDRIRLARKPAAAPQDPQPGAFRKFVDETFGWEGGFFAAMFWNLGGAGVSSAPPSASSAWTAAPAETLRIRSLVGRAYMMDLAVLAGASDSIVCAVSATGCRLLAVMMGWEAAVDKGRWINIDGEYGWWAVDV
ncbi:hypothetical protein HMPREF1624_01476 [Sporothrix schenckii ATCC 58251]|uniref:Uncharacterized protein n=1 Tax=Sporothrix schenckii (strain ATCC 58251 / de Perez 2211183) TaxID=1391915 RepID=U7Q8S0_SPOS1|nr:hypothetical protein HMPREF1624_01476 [Sporothrix schenckii ATCC 58251]